VGDGPAAGVATEAWALGALPAARVPPPAPPLGAWPGADPEGGDDPAGGAALGVGPGAWVGTGVGRAVGAGVAVGAVVAVWCGVAVAVGLGVGVGVGFAVGVGVFSGSIGEPLSGWYAPVVGCDPPLGALADPVLTPAPSRPTQTAGSAVAITRRSRPGDRALMRRICAQDAPHARLAAALPR
jgi:hypothetical protein